MIASYGTSVPLMDSWDIEASGIYKPLVEGAYHFKNLFAPVAEHHFVFYKLLSLLIFQGNNQQWDALPQLCVHAALYAMIGAVLAWILIDAFGIAVTNLAILVVGVSFALPVEWENVIRVIGVPYFFELLFSLLAIWGAGLHPALSGRWFFGVVMALCALVSNGAGFLASASIFLIAAYNAMKAGRITRGNAVTLVLKFGFIVSGKMMAHPDATTAPLKAHSLHAFFLALTKNMSWPFDGYPWLALIQLPLLIFLIDALRTKAPQRAHQLAIGIGAYVWLHMLATAYARGANGHGPMARHIDAHVLGLIFGAFCLLSLVKNAPARFRPFVAIGAASWCVLIAGGFAQECVGSFVQHYPQMAAARPTMVANVRAYLASHDPSALRDKRAGELPYPMPERLAQKLDDPMFVKILPAILQNPIRLDSQNSAGFTNDASSLPAPRADIRVWSSYSKNGASEKAFFRSQPITASLPYLQFETLGSKTTMTLTSADGVAIRKTLPRSVGEWRRVHVKTPKSPFTIEVKNERADAWCAFTEPKQIGRLSRVADGLLAHANTFCLGSIAALLLLLFYGAFAAVGDQNAKSPASLT